MSENRTKSVVFVLTKKLYTLDVIITSSRARTEVLLPSNSFLRYSYWLLFLLSLNLGWLNWQAINHRLRKLWHRELSQHMMCPKISIAIASAFGALLLFGEAMFSFVGWCCLLFDRNWRMPWNPKTKRDLGNRIF